MKEPGKVDIGKLKDEIEEASADFKNVREEVARVVVGQSEAVERLLSALLAGGHVLLEGVPGLAKTTMIKALAQAVQTKFQRIQFTPDLLPSDLVGTQVYNPQKGTFSVKKGPIFTNFLLADEINRAPAKVQSALLEAMQEHQVTIGDETFILEEPFLVLATQNPIEQEGTYPLPEAQVDRFMFKVLIGYPSREEEKEIVLRNMDDPFKNIKKALNPKDLIEAQALVRRIYMDEKILDYILTLVAATRNPKEFKLKLENLIEFGASPRASIALSLAARARAFLQGRGYVVPQDVKSAAADVLRHRIILSYEAEAEEKSPDDILKMILDEIPVP